MRVPASSSSPLSSKTCALLEHPFQQSLAPQIQELCLPLTKTGVQEKMQKKKRSIVVRSCFTQKCFVFLIWQWCNGDRWQSWQLTCWKVSRNGKMKSAIELFFNFFFSIQMEKTFFLFLFCLDTERWAQRPECQDDQNPQWRDGHRVAPAVPDPK